MEESDVFVESDLKTHTGCNLNEMADYGNGMFLKLTDCGINEIDTQEELGQDDTESWDIYTRYAQFHDLVQFSSLKKQFTSSTIDVQLHSLCSNDIKALTEALKANKHVITFNLNGNQLEYVACNYLSNLLKNNRRIKHLMLSMCEIDSKGAIELAKSLESTDLNTLDLSYNNIECTGVQSISEALQINTSIQELDLKENGITSDCIGDICTILDMNENLVKLNLSGNVLNKESGLLLLMRTLGNSNDTLQILILQWNGISGEVCATMIKNLMIKTRGLKLLDLSWNNFSDVGKILSMGIKKTATLEHFDISNNPLTADDVVELLNGVVEQSSLRILGLSHIIVDEHLEEAITNAQLRVPNFNVNVRLYTGIKTDPVDLQVLYLKRMHYLGVDKPKKKTNKVDIGKKLLNMSKAGNLEPMKKEVFLSTFEKLKIKESEEVIEGLAKAFQNINRRIDVSLMLDKYLELYPNTI